VSHTPSAFLEMPETIAEQQLLLVLGEGPSSTLLSWFRMAATWDGN
jgi:hypothetical protein